MHLWLGEPIRGRDDQAYSGSDLGLLKCHGLLTDGHVALQELDAGVIWALDDGDMRAGPQLLAIAADLFRRARTADEQIDAIQAHHQIDLRCRNPTTIVRQPQG
jgi:hypothetical protein